MTYFSLRLKRKYQENLNKEFDSEDLETEIRTWYLDKTNLSPLDPHYYNLPYEYIEYSYVRFFSKPDPYKIRDIIVRNKHEDKANEESDRRTKENLEQYSGFDPEMMEKVFEEFKGATRR